MTKAIRSWFALTIALSASSCGKKQERLDVDLGGPRPALPASSAPSASRFGRYEIASGSAILFSAPGRKQAPAGRIQYVSGHIELDPLRPQTARGSVRADLTSLSMDADADASAQEYTTRAKNWLGLGSERSKEVLEMLRFATFDLEQITSGGARGAHEERVRTTERSDTLGSGAKVESRTVELTATGSFTLGGRRVRQSAELTATFEYDGFAMAAGVPKRIVVDTREPLFVALATHDVQPRDERGTELSGDLPLVGPVVGHRARVTAHLVLERVDQPRSK